MSVGYYLEGIDLKNRKEDNKVKLKEEEIGK